MRRREVIACLGGVTLAWSSAGQAQQPPRILRIGLLADGPLQEMDGFEKRTSRPRVCGRRERTH